MFADGAGLAAVDMVGGGQSATKRVAAVVFQFSASQRITFTFRRRTRLYCVVLSPSSSTLRVGIVAVFVVVVVAVVFCVCETEQPRCGQKVHM